MDKERRVKGEGKGERERAGNPQNLYAAYAHAWRGRQFRQVIHCCDYLKLIDDVTKFHDQKEIF
jgi:hypothetical protein